MNGWVRGFIGWVEDHPWLMLGTVLVITFFFIASLAVVGLRFEADFKKFLPKDEPAVRALNRAEATYGAQDLFLIALVADDTIFNPSTLRKFKEIEERIEGLVGVDRVRGPASSYVIYGTQDSVVVEKAMKKVPETPEEIAEYKRRMLGDRNIVGLIISEDGKAGAISVELDPFEADAPTVVAQIQEILREYEGPERIYLAGEPVLRTTIAGSMLRDLKVLIPFVVLVMIAVLFLSFRSLRGVVLPMLVVIISTIWAVGTMALAGVPLTPFAVLMPVMLIAIGAADGIHILNKYYEEAAKRSQGARHRASRREIVIRTMEEMAAPVILTSLTTAAGFTALLASFLWPQRMFGVFTAIGIIYAMILSFTLIPALLARLKVPQIQGRFETSPLARLLGRFARSLSRRPGWVLALAALVLFVFAAAIPHLRVETRPDEFLGKDHPVIQAMNVMEDHFGGSYQLAIEIDTGRRDGLKDPALLKEIVALQEYLKKQPGVGAISSVANIARQMNEILHASDPQYYRVPEDPRLAASIFLLYSGPPGKLFTGDFSKGEVLVRRANLGSIGMARLVKTVQSYLDEHFNRPGAPKAELVGPTRAYTALLSRITTSQITSLLASILAAGFLVALLMWSGIAGLLGILPLILTVIVEFGVMAYANLPIDMATLMLGSIAIGIGIDYAIHFMSRFRLETSSGRDQKTAFENTMRTAGKGIVYNALALMLGFAVLLVSSFQGLINFGLLIMLTMFISSLSAFTVIPAILMLRKPAFLRSPGLFVEPALIEANPILEDK